MFSFIFYPNVRLQFIHSTQYVLGLYFIATHIPDDKLENTQISTL